jgi:quercetin dioxygenase-like cupin family protein
MRHPWITRGLAIAAMAGVIATLIATPSLAVNPIEAQPLTGRATFTDDVDLKFKVKLAGMDTNVVNLEDPTYTQTVMFTVQPGAMFPWHTHPASVVVNVVSGELVYVAAMDCVERPYGPGEAFFDPGFGHVHTAFNRGSAPTVLMATFYGLPATGPLSQSMTPPAGCEVGP